MKLSTVVGSFIVVVLTSHSVQALTLPPVPTEPIYYEPPVVGASNDVRLQSCVQLDNAIRSLHPYQYSYKPKFTDDSYNAVAVGTAVLDVSLNGVLSAGYLGYSALVEDKEQRRMLQVQQHISMLQTIKAEKHCFE